jgi:hypothetical protein
MYFIKGSSVLIPCLVPVLSPPPCSHASCPCSVLIPQCSPCFLSLFCSYPPMFSLLLIPVLFSPPMFPLLLVPVLFSSPTVPPASSPCSFLIPPCSPCFRRYCGMWISNLLLSKKQPEQVFYTKSRCVA